MSSDIVAGLLLSMEGSEDDKQARLALNDACMELGRLRSELALARAVVEAARQILKCGEGLGFYALDRAIYAYDAATKDPDK